MFGLDRIAIYVIIAGLLAGMATAAYLGWEHVIEQRALAASNQAQMEQTLRDQQKYIQQQQDLNDSARDAVRQMENNNASMRRQLGSVNTYLNSPQARTADRPTSDVLKQTINQLRSLQQQETLHQ